MRERAGFAKRSAGFAAAVAAATGLISLLPRRAGSGASNQSAGTDALHDLPPARYDQRDAAFAPMAYGAAGVLVALAAALGIATWLYPAPDKTLRFPPPVAYPGPSLQPDPQADMARFREEQLRQLNGAYWLDKAAGTVHLPIEDAMRLVARDGIADWPKTPYPPAVPAR